MQVLKQQTMKSLRKALGILDLFLENQGELALSQIAKLSGLNKTTASRIVLTLVEYGYLKQREKRGKYSLGTIYLGFTGVVKGRLQLRNVAIPYLTKLSQQTHESVIIAYGNGREEVFTETFQDTSQPNNVLRIVPLEGTGMPLHSTATGKILLAYMTDEELEEYFKNKHLRQFTPNTIININDMRNHLMIVRQEGMAFDDEEFSLGVRGVAAGIRDNEGKIVGSFAVVAPLVRLTRVGMRELVPSIKSYAEEISGELGFRG
jgi:IclR family transcriptional regulator, KDG regulon repressor